jgi:predicted small lipoprotein YifL
VTASTPGVRTLLVAALLAVAACGPTGPTSVPGASTAPTATAASSPSAAATTGASAEASAGGLTQTDTTWGRIWDGVPTGFPRATGARDADDATAEPVSDAYVVEGGDAADIASTLQAALEGATYSTESLSGPLEDGRFVL